MGLLLIQITLNWSQYWFLLLLYSTIEGHWDGNIGYIFILLYIDFLNSVSGI